MRKCSYERELKILQENFDPSMLFKDSTTVSEVQNEAQAPARFDNMFLQKFKLLLS